MFRFRLKVMLLLAGLASALIVARLVELQVLRAGEFRQTTRQMLRRRPEPLPFIRGAILDRTGAVVASDEPCWEVCVDYAAIDLTGNALAGLVRQARRDHRYPSAGTDDEVKTALRADVDATWARLARFDHVDIDEMRRRAERIRDRVQRVHDWVEARWGFPRDVREQRMAFAVIAGLSDSRQIDAREAFRDVPWVSVRSARRRVVHGGASLAHVVGRVATVDANTLRDDPNAEDPFAAYTPDDIHGASGVEWLAERTLRGRRGQIVRQRDGGVVDSGLIEPINGTDVALTINAALQERLYTLAGQAVRRDEHISGGAIVVLDVDSREVLALVSYPSYDPSSFRSNYEALRDRTDTLPLRFRAVSSAVAPGSIIKPLVCLVGLTRGVITLDDRVTCTGYLFPNNPGAPTSRCWEVHGTGARKAHGSVDLLAALRGSCNIYMYHLGMNLGADALAGGFDMVGIGRATGIGLREEARGLNPTPSWLSRHGRSITPGMLRLLAMGQGDLLMTPVQAANLAACYASGTLRAVRLIRDAPPSPEWTLPGTARQWAVVRRALFEVVNDTRGTAHAHACLRDDRYALCGKTGSATVFRRATVYRAWFRDAEGVQRFEDVPAGSRSEAGARFRARADDRTVSLERVEPIAFWPPGASEGQRFAHAWFAGYLQAVDATGEPIEARTPRVALSVLLEYGGSGGRAAGPLARDVARTLIDTLGPALGSDAAERKASHP